MTAQITDVLAWEAIDSRGDPTVAVEIRAGEVRGAAFAPSGASTGAAEARVLRDGDTARYAGRGVLRAVANVRNVIGPALLGLDPADQLRIDALLIELDGSPDKSRLGANALIAASLAAAHAGAAARRLPLYQHCHDLLDVAGSEAGADRRRASGPRMPMPMTNMISGGLHAGGNLSFQDVLAIPKAAADTAQAIEWLVRTYRRLGEGLARSGFEGRLVGDEGGFGPRLAGVRQALECVMQAIETAGLEPGEQVVLALDVAASHFFKGGMYHVAEAPAPLPAEGMIDFLETLARDFPVVSIEDGLAEDDWSGWRRLTERLGGKLRLVGDDLLATNPRRIERGVSEGAANAALIKVNQIGTLSETFEALLACEAAGWTRIVSARSGETEDATIADLAVGVAADYIKIGAIVRGERTAKYNRLLRIAAELDAWA